MTMTIMTEYRLNVTIIPQYHSCPYYYFRISSKYLADNIISDIAPIKPTKYIMAENIIFYISAKIADLYFAGNMMIMRSSAKRSVP